ncbi:hypothetical protein [Terribacillus saccharophilus]|uniref:hypothetical protein n=2 Tax=Terribacillus saccharophilus TaxID=361277 RepID=UPI001C3F1040|nr:hypothetical protein [Terribacillus saccharophilus]
MITLSKRVIVTMMTGISISIVMTSCQAKEDTAVERSRSTSNAGVSNSRSTISKDSVYADGTYKATGQYGSLPSSITVTATLVDNAINEVKVTPHATNPTSLDLQRRFANAVPAVVVGKRIDEVKVGRLAGSSHTPDGFNDAIQQIKEQARIEDSTSK